jgi:hypothetical protein
MHKLEKPDGLVLNIWEFLPQIWICEMAKKILQIGTDKFGDIYSGGNFQLVTRNVKIENLEVSEITEYLDMDAYLSYFIHFENSTKTLEVFDVNYVIRDEE